MDLDLISELYQSMLRIRRFEEESARLYTERKIAGFLHLYIGQEAIATGAYSVMNPETDKIVTAYRCHGHYLAAGGSVKAGYAELLGKETGCAKGRGGSMHFYDIKNGFLGGWGIVGAQLPCAAGVAFAQKYQNTGGITICYLGDGAINIGPFHEAMSLAALWKLPVIFVIENNGFAMGTPIAKTSVTDDLSIRALGYPMARDTMNGHDIFDIRSKVHKAVTRAREESMPTLIEAKTYRYRGHSMSDPAKYRTKADVQEWKDKDPIMVLGKTIEEMGYAELKKQIDDEVEKEIQDGLEFAEKSPFPDPSKVFDYVEHSL